MRTKSCFCLLSREGWISYDKDIFIIVKFTSLVELTGFATRGANNHRGEVWLTKYKVFTKVEENSSWNPYMDGQVFLIVLNVKFCLSRHSVLIL